MHDAFSVAQAIWRNAGFAAPLYVSIISGPSGTADIENIMIQGASGPPDFHVILLDNGRSALAKDPILKEALYCIKCGTCLFECPVFQLAAGYYGGKAYFGGVGSVLSAFVGGEFKDAAPLVFTCLRCGHCTQFCPSSIDTSKLVTELRSRIVKSAA
jgi:L-lactate dehydrogenase complex protein LldG